MSIIIKKILLVCFTIFVTGVFLVYLKLFWHFPRSPRYETNMIQVLENLKEKGDTLSTFRLESIMDFKWHKVIHVGPYLDVPDGTRKCGIDFSILRNAPLNHYDHYRAFLFFDEKNNPVKYLLFEGMIYGFEQINKKYSCGTTKQNAVFRLWQFKKEQFFRIQFAN